MGFGFGPLQALNADGANVMPPRSEAQRRAMRAAASGKSTLGIPKSVGKDFSKADPGGKLPKKVKKSSSSRKRSA